MDTEKLFLRLNGVFCFGVALNFLWNAGFFLKTRLGSDPQLINDFDRFLEKFLRDLAGGSPYLLSLATYLPALMMFSLMLGFYMYLHQRDRWLSMLALVFGLLLGGIFIGKQVTGSRLTQVAMKYVAEANYTSRLDLLKEARSLYGLQVFQHLLINRASILAYVLIGILFIKSPSLYEVVVGYSFLGSAGILLLYLLTRGLFWQIEDSVAFTVPAVSFILAGIALLKAKHREKGG